MRVLVDVPLESRLAAELEPGERLLDARSKGFVRRSAAARIKRGERDPDC